MKIKRLGVATTSAILYPAAIALVAGAITFRIVPVFAESSAPFTCTDPVFTNCDGKGQGESCACASGTGTCSCQSRVCNGGDLNDGGIGNPQKLGCFPAATSSSGTSPPPAEEDDGCSTAGSPLSSGSAASFAVALGAVIGLLWTKKRRR